MFANSRRDLAFYNRDAHGRRGDPPLKSQVRGDARRGPFKLQESIARMPPSSLRDRKKAATRLTLLEVAHRRFHEVGFDDVTLEEICDTAAISKRTFFRYFRSKEALVFPNRDKRLAEFQQVLDSAAPGESPFDTLRRATRAGSEEHNANARQILAQQLLIRQSSTLQACEAEIDRDWEAAMAGMLARAGEGAEAQLRVRVLAGAAIGVVRATMRYWYETNGAEDLCTLGLQALDCLERGFPLEAHPE
ncbi:MAG: AcrR family transcriptional regulator [Myxococcota bacterium]|jgi:AcrR family transcriptional regulator